MKFKPGDELICLCGFSSCPKYFTYVRHSVYHILKSDLKPENIFGDSDLKHVMLLSLYNSPLMKALNEVKE